jgi:hypothetical protein
VTGHVFEKDPLWAAFADDPGDIGPEVARVVGPTAFASGTEGLAGISGEDDVEGAAKGSGIKAAQIVPDWGRDEIPCALGGDEDRSWPALPFDEGAGVEIGFGKHDAHIQASAACAEGQSVPGT